MANSFLSIQRVKKSFGDLTVVQDFNLDVGTGEFVSFLGPSGCGKTTVLRMVAGFEEPTAGSIVIAGKDVTRLKPNQRNIGMVFQAYALFPNLTVAQNIGFGLKVAGMPKADSDKRVAEMLELIKLPQFGDRYPYQLSGGQQQRVALARAIAPKPKLLLLDEPLSALDAKVRVSLRDEIRAIQKELGITTVFVTHDQEEALSISDRIVVMYGGKVEQVGTPFEIYNRPSTKFVANFVGTLNVLEGTVTDASSGKVKVGAGEVVLKGKLNGSKVRRHAVAGVAPRGDLARPAARPRRHARRRDFRGQLPRLGHPRACGSRQGGRLARHLQQPGLAAADRRREGRDQLLARRRAGAALSWTPILSPHEVGGEVSRASSARGRRGGIKSPPCDIRFAEQRIRHAAVHGRKASERLGTLRGSGPTRLVPEQVLGKRQREGLRHEKRFPLFLRFLTFSLRSRFG